MTLERIVTISASHQIESDCGPPLSQGQMDPPNGLLQETSLVDHCQDRSHSVRHMSQLRFLMKVMQNSKKVDNDSLSVNLFAPASAKEFAAVCFLGR
jgi:hypothetical protein